MLKKIISVIILLIMLSSALIACTDKKTTSATTSGTVSTDDEANKLNLPERDMGGFKLTFLSYTDGAHPWSLKTMVEGEGTDAVSQAIFDRNALIEYKYNCVIAKHQIVYMIETLTTLAMGGSDENYQVPLIYDNKVNMAKVNGLLGNFNIMTWVDLEKPWWNKDASACFTINGEQYGAVGDMSLSMYSKNYCYFFNSEMYNNGASAENLYDLVRDKEWTLEKMLKVAADYTNVNGDDDTHRYGIAGTAKVHYQLVLSGAGLRFVEVDESGNPYFALNTANAIDMMSDIISRFSSTNAYYNNNPTKPNGGIISTEFQNGKVLFLASTIWNMRDYDNYDFQVGVVPAPLYSDDQNDYHSVTIGGLVTCISRIIPEQDIENVSIILEAMSYYGREKVVSKYKDDLIKARYARTLDDKEMLQLIFDSSFFDLGTSVWNIEIRTPIMEGVFNKLNPNVSSYITSLAPAVDEAIRQSKLAS